jgi:hypothetical protein
METGHFEMQYDIREEERKSLLSKERENTKQAQKSIKAVADEESKKPLLGGEAFSGYV